MSDEEIEKICKTIKNILTNKEYCITEFNCTDNLISEEISFGKIDTIKEFNLNIVYHELHELLGR